MRVLLANDASPHSQAAAAYLMAIPFRKPIDVEIVSAVMPLMFMSSGISDMPADLGAFLDEERNCVKERIEHEADEIRKSARRNFLHGVRTRIPVGPPATELLKVAESTDTELIVLGAVGHSALDRVLLGSVSDYVATHADASILIVRPKRDSERPPSLTKVIIALSGAAEDHRMIDWLKQLELRPNVEVHLVRVLRLETLYRQDIRQTASKYWQAFRREAQQQILDFETQLQAMGLNTETHLVESGHVGDALIEYAETHGCDLILTGDSDSGLLTRLFMGSTSRYVLRHAMCSVLIVRDKVDRQNAKLDAAQRLRQQVEVEG
ncbi:universal stress protein UspE [Rubripirellula tenax]|uniref:Universal stress protein UspE n=1 Tax=Rubripirellula tenax TaxID=2528015 RepID=A0A5C6ECE6_9BACT|nr:universal stress protein [Rubripirellula tenax]TWU46155.1 universal stress protein UspE [Rubripirellula tenax]